MQQQARPPAAQDQQRPAYHAPIAPRIPQNHIQSLIPRLTTTINDIDSFRTLLAQGAQDGTMPDWDVTLQRYSLLLGRITALSNYISQPPARPPNLPPSATISTKPALESYLVHPLNPLPSGEAAAAAGLSPFAPDVFFQVINTLPLPALSAAQDELKTTPSLALRGMDERELDRLEGRLKDRLKRESGRARSLIDEVERKSGEVDWTMRVDQEEDDDGSLFGGGSDEGADESKDDAAKTATADAPASNAREGWTIQDYVRFMETGKPPAASATSAA